MKITQLEKKLLHYTGKGIADYNMIQRGDKVLVCLSGGKDSFVLVRLLHLLELRSNHKFSMFVFILDQGLPGWDDTPISNWLIEKKIPFEIERQNTFSIVQQKMPKGSVYCPLCSRLRRGAIYSYAKKHGFVKIALGHHRDDLISSLLMSILYSGEIRSQPPKLLTNDKRHIVIRPMVYCQEKDIECYAEQMDFPVAPKNLCGVETSQKRVEIKALIQSLADKNPKVPSCMLHAISNVKPSQLMDHHLWNFKDLEKALLHDGENVDDIG